MDNRFRWEVPLTEAVRRAGAKVIADRCEVSELLAETAAEDALKAMLEAASKGDNERYFVATENPTEP